MKILSAKPMVISCMLLMMSIGSKAQYTETFETHTQDFQSFTSDGQPFTLTNAFAIFSSRSGLGYGRSNSFIDNSSAVAKNQVNSIVATDSKLFSVQNLWLFTSTDGGNKPSSNGSLIITGKLNGVVVFTITKITGFNNSYGANDGFTYINFASEGGADYSHVSINEINFQLQGEFNYLAIDNFTFTKAASLPVSVTSFYANLQSGKVALKWQTSCESNSSHFLVERSNEGINYKTMARLEGAGNCSILTNYSTLDEHPNSGNNFYRLVAVDFDGKRKIHGIILIKNQVNNVTIGLYPNPSKGNSINIRGNNNLAGQLYTIIDMSGKILQNGIISGSSQALDISSISRGNYILKLSDGQSIQWIKN